MTENNKGKRRSKKKNGREEMPKSKSRWQNIDICNQVSVEDVNMVAHTLAEHRKSGPYKMN